MRVRIKFRKHGPVRYIGHLDLMRFFQKAMRRAQIDVAYTAGFNPHQIMSFAAPLGVGVESNGEYVDVECHSVTSSMDMIQRLNQTSAPGIEIVDVRLLSREAGNAMASVAAARYTVCFREDRAPKTANWEEKTDPFLAREHIFVPKETRTGTKEIDIRPGIFEMKSSQSKIELLLDASSAGNLKPATVLTAFFEYMGEILPENALKITREEVYTYIDAQDKVAARGDFVKLGAGMLVPLEAVGTPIEGDAADE